jgi:hypothetical protein
MSEEQELYFTTPMITEALAACYELMQRRERDFVTVSQGVAGMIGLSLVDVRRQVQGWYDEVRDKMAAAGEDILFLSPRREPWTFFPPEPDAKP